MTTERGFHRGARNHRRAFTLTEMLVVIMVIAILASIVLFALAGVQEQSRVKRTRAQIARLNELIMQRWQSYQTRRVPMPIVQNNPRRAALDRLNAIRELMRMEMPDRITDVLADPVVLRNRPALSRAFLRRATKDWTPQHQGAECLYMIVSRIQVGNSNGLEFFSENELGDVDQDGMPEILDAWGTPIRWLRWPAGFRSPLQDGNPANGRDPFDPTDLFPDNYAIYPLIVSAGPDRLFDLGFDHEQQVSYAAVGNDPYSEFGGGGRLGVVIDANGDGQDNSLDNIHNHLLMAN